MEINLSDEERLVKLLSKLDPDKFLTLCRMHLSFILDLDCERLELIGDNYNVMHSKEKTKRAIVLALPRKSKILGMKESDTNSSQSKYRRALDELIEFLELDANIVQEGLFRKSGKVSRQEELLKQIRSGNVLNLKSGCYSPHDCASVLKKFLSELPEPLLTEQHYSVHCQIVDLCHVSFVGEQKMSATKRQVEALQILFFLLPNKNRRMLRSLLNLLFKVTKQQAGNKMDATNLATLFAPHILCPRKMSAENFCNNSGNMIRAVSCMIENAPELFKLPERLATDLKLLWKSKTDSTKKKDEESTKTQSYLAQFSNQIGSYDEAVTTATTFCVRQPAVEDATAVELSRLYAHVQALPESNKKQQLIKQFNKENGSGTPLSRETQRNHHRSKSLKKSIKKHLFGRHKRNRSSDILSDPVETNELTSDVCLLIDAKACDCSEDLKRVPNIHETKLLQKPPLQISVDKCICNPTRKKGKYVIGRLNCCINKPHQQKFQQNELKELCSPQAQPNLTSYRSVLSGTKLELISSQMPIKSFNSHTRRNLIFKETSL